MIYPQWLQERIAKEIDDGEISDATKEAIAGLADDQTLAELFASFDAIVAASSYLKD